MEYCTPILAFKYFEYLRDFKFIKDENFFIEAQCVDKAILPQLNFNNYNTAGIEIDNTIFSPGTVYTEELLESITGSKRDLIGFGKAGDEYDVTNHGKIGLIKNITFDKYYEITNVRKFFQKIKMSIVYFPYLKLKEQEELVDYMVKTKWILEKIKNFSWIFQEADYEVLSEKLGTLNDRDMDILAEDIRLTQYSEIFAHVEDDSDLRLYYEYFTNMGIWCNVAASDFYETSELTQRMPYKFDNSFLGSVLCIKNSKIDRCFKENELYYKEPSQEYSNYSSYRIKMAEIKFDPKNDLLLFSNIYQETFTKETFHKIAEIEERCNRPIAKYKECIFEGMDCLEIETIFGKSVEVVDCKFINCQIPIKYLNRMEDCSLSKCILTKFGELERRCDSGVISLIDCDFLESESIEQFKALLKEYKVDVELNSPNISVNSILNGLDFKDRTMVANKIFYTKSLATEIPYDLLSLLDFSTERYGFDFGKELIINNLTSVLLNSSFNLKRYKRFLTDDEYNYLKIKFNTLD